MSTGLKRSALVDAAGDGVHLGYVAADADPGTVWHRVVASGNVWQSVATVVNHRQRDSTTGLETRRTWRGLEMVENGGR